MQIEGACHCGLISFTAEVDPSRVMVCHYSDCQVLSGAPFRAVVAAPIETLVLRGTPKSYVKVAPVQASVEPEGATAPGSNAGALVDGSVQEWTMTWQPSVGSSCGAAADTGTIVLSFAPTRVRQIQILPGLDKSNPQRPLQPLPQEIGITFDDGKCHPFTLTPKEEQLLKVDSRTKTATVRIGIGSATSPGPDAPQLLSITEIVVQAFPR